MTHSCPPQAACSRKRATSYSVAAMVAAFDEAVT